MEKALSIIAQVMVSEGGILFFGSVISGGIGWTLKKLFDVDTRLARIEERCKVHFPHE